MSRGEPLNVIEIDLGALRHNVRRIRKQLRPGTGLMIIVKAEAYGHGMVRIAREVAKLAGVAYLGVSSSAEAFRLRDARIRKPILVLGVVHPRDAAEIVRRGVTATVSSLDEARMLDRAAARTGRRARVHVELDTGMGRLGVWCAEAIRLVHAVHELAHVELEGVFTHFPSADEEDARFSRFQIEAFEKAVDYCQELFGRPIRYVHMANSAGLVAYRDAHFTLVRPGLAVYGLNPAKRTQALGLKPVLTLKSRAAFLKTVEKGRTISYARTHVTPRPTRIATVPLGYSSGYPVSLSNRAHVLIRGRRYPVVGRVTMDHLMVDVGLKHPVRRWDEVVLIGRSGRERIRAEELAGLAGTIPYEIVTRLGLGVPRIYKG
jgi:alanine racemase